jgi:hypothetical protein
MIFYREEREEYEKTIAGSSLPNFIDSVSVAPKNTKASAAAFLITHTKETFSCSRCSSCPGLFFVTKNVVKPRRDRDF